LGHGLLRLLLRHQRRDLIPSAWLPWGTRVLGVI
jgi:hypothetical protein